MLKIGHACVEIQSKNHKTEFNKYAVQRRDMLFYLGHLSCIAIAENVTKDKRQFDFASFDLSPFLKRCLHSSISPVNLLHPHTPGICNAFFWTSSSHLILGFPTALVSWDFPLRIFGIHSSSILNMLPAHPNLLILLSSTIFRSL